MTSKSKAFLVFLALALCLSIGVTYYRYVILKDFTVFLNEEEIPGTWDPFNL